MIEFIEHSESNRERYRRKRENWKPSNERFTFGWTKDCEVGNEMNSFYVLEDQRFALGRLLQNLWVKSDVGWKREREEGERERDLFRSLSRL